MHSIRTTPGLIISSKPYGESGRLLHVFTRDLGLVRAVAQGIRLEKSKLRYHCQEHSFGSFSFVRGKDLWRLTNSGTHVSGEPVNIMTKEEKELVARICSLLRRLLQGEEPHPELFVCIENLGSFLAGAGGLNKERLIALESLIVFRILHHLGYIGRADGLDNLRNSPELSLEILEAAGAKRIEINKHINTALKESQL